MGKRVVLTLIGSFEQGITAILRIVEKFDTTEREIQVAGQLPPAPKLSQLFKQWQLSYHQVATPYSRIKFKPVQVTQVSCRQLSSQLLIEFNYWLNSGQEWHKIRNSLQLSLQETDEVLVVIETDQIQIQQLPWHLWDLFSKYYTKIEVALSLPEYQSFLSTEVVSTNRVRILAILGNSEGIDVKTDRALLESLPDAEVTFLVEPKRQELNEQLWNSGWDILFFAGHSNQADEKNGQIYINQTDSLTINDLKYALRTAVANGLKFAIFNSCDGLGIAKDLASLNIPQLIVMREPVPDRVAQEFLKYFLTTYTNGKSFYAAVREAREKLQGWEDEFPCASWLPVICQSSTLPPPTWQQLCSTESAAFKSETKQQKFQTLSTKNCFAILLAVSTITTVTIMGLRQLGILQALELQAFDHLMRLRPAEPPDPRLLVVTVTEDDLQLPQQQQRKSSLSDTALNQLLRKLEQFKPRVIGLDIYRDFPVEAGQKDLATQMRQNENLVAVCKASDITVKDPGVASPPEVPTERLGFSDFITDPDGVLRRHLLAMDLIPASPCNTQYAFSIQLAFRYLAAQGILPKYTKDGILQIGSTAIKPLESRIGGYQTINTWGYQLLLNYRSPHSPEKIADTITLAQVLNGRLEPTDFQDRIILIGTTAASFQDYWQTPYSNGSSSAQELSGVLAQAQMTSQILSTVLDKRPLLWAYPQWIEIIWVFGWSVAGGILAMRWNKSPKYLGLAVIAVAGGVYGICFGLLLQHGCWVPLIPPVLALAATSVSIAAIAKSQAGRHQYSEVYQPILQNHTVSK